MAGVSAIYRSNTLEVRDATRFGTEAVVVTFTPRAARPSLSASSFGERYFEKIALDAIHIVCAGNDWYQYADLDEALMAGRTAASGRRVITYGSSMGGYAAFHFAGMLGADLAIGISPQYSIQRGKVPFETRWHAEAERTHFLRDDFVACPGTRYLAIYDPLSTDRLHVEAYRTHGPVEAVGVCFSGHPSGPHLGAIGALSRIFLEAMAGDVNRSAVIAAHRARRRQSPTYWNWLARRAHLRRHRRVALAAAGRAAELAPGDYPIWAFLGERALEEGMQKIAERAFMHALELAPQKITFLEHVVRLRLGEGRADEARAALDAYRLPEAASDKTRQRFEHLMRLSAQPR